MPRSHPQPRLWDPPGSPGCSGCQSAAERHWLVTENWRKTSTATVGSEAEGVSRGLGFPSGTTTDWCRPRDLPVPLCSQATLPFVPFPLTICWILLGSRAETMRRKETHEEQSAEEWCRAPPSGDSGCSRQSHPQPLHHFTFKSFRLHSI